MGTRTAGVGVAAGQTICIAGLAGTARGEEVPHLTDRAGSVVAAGAIGRTAEAQSVAVVTAGGASLAVSG